MNQVFFIHLHAGAVANFASASSPSPLPPSALPHVDELPRPPTMVHHGGTMSNRGGNNSRGYAPRPHPYDPPAPPSFSSRRHPMGGSIDRQRQSNMRRRESLLPLPLPSLMEPLPPIGRGRGYVPWGILPGGPGQLPRNEWPTRISIREIEGRERVVGDVGHTGMIVEGGDCRDKDLQSLPLDTLHSEVASGEEGGGQETRRDGEPAGTTVEGGHCRGNGLHVPPSVTLPSEAGGGGEGGWQQTRRDGEPAGTTVEGGHCSGDGLHVPPSVPLPSEAGGDGVNPNSLCTPLIPPHSTSASDRQGLRRKEGKKKNKERKMNKEKKKTKKKSKKNKKRR